LSGSAAPRRQHGQPRTARYALGGPSGSGLVPLGGRGRVDGAIPGPTVRTRAARVTPSEGMAALRRDVVAAVQSAVVPVIDDIQRALTSGAAPGGMDQSGLGQRLEVLHAEVIDLIDRVTSPTGLAGHIGDEVREELFAAMHGPVLGRLAACAMALNFHCDPSLRDPGGVGDAMAMSVRTHLDAVSRDLTELRMVRSPHSQSERHPG
jgi:hypothetical protein